MNKIPESLRSQLSDHPLRSKCLRHLALKDHQCDGRITWEHAIVYAGRQVQEPWAIVFLCAWAHSVDSFQDGGGLKKEINEWIAINRMSPEDEEKYPRRDWQQRRKYLNGVYGELPLSVKV